MLAVAEARPRAARHDAASGRRAEEEDRQRREGEQRLELAQELHDVLAHHISLINVQAGVALHLIDEQPERARPALPTIKAASREALRELRGALDILRRGDGRAADAGPAARPTSTASSPPSAPAGSTSGSTTAPARRTCRPPSSWPPTASCRRR